MAPRTDHLHHSALCVTDDESGVRAALAAVLENAALMDALLGPDSVATVEVAPLPAELRGRLCPSTTAISFAVDDLDERVAACRALGLDVTVDVGGGSLCFAVVMVAGLEFELVGVSERS